MSDFNYWLNMLSECKEDFQVIISRNSTFIKTSDGNKMPFINNRLNPAIFSVVRLLKKETESWLKNNERFNTFRDRSMIRYYNYAPKLPSTIDQFYFIDISAAYITSLKINGIISEKLFNRINELPKKDRLISLGMLAYEPYIINYVGGKKDGPPIRDINYYSPVFYQACSFIQDLMYKVIDLIKDKKPFFYRDAHREEYNYLFYWVDGIFFRDKDLIGPISELLTSEGYIHRAGNCFNWACEEKENHYTIRFNQEDKGEILPKEYNIPVHFYNNQLNYQAIKFIQEEKYDEFFRIFKDKFKENDR